MVESARRHAVASCLACIAGLGLALVLAYWVGPLERLDRSLLDALSAPTGSFANEAAYAAVKLADPVAFVIAATIAALVALARGRIWVRSASMVGEGICRSQSTRFQLRPPTARRLKASSPARRLIPRESLCSRDNKQRGRSRRC
jgi:hypothetical protein